MSSEPKSPSRPLWPLAIVAVCAAGAGISGTLLWTQSRAAQPAAPPPTGVLSSQPSPLDGLPPAVQNLPKAPPSQVAQPVAPQTPPDLDATPPAETLARLTPPQKALVSGNWYFDHQNWPRAITEYQTAIQSGIDNPNVRTDLGSAYRFAKQPQKALEQYEIAQKQDPKHENSLFNQGALYAFSMGQTAKGVAIWRETLQRFPNGINAKAARQLIQQAEQGKAVTKPKTAN